MAAATLSDGALLAILWAAPEIRVPFCVDNHHGSELGGKSQGGRRDRNQPCHENPQCECITLDRTRSAFAVGSPKSGQRDTPPSGSMTRTANPWSPGRSRM